MQLMSLLSKAITFITAVESFVEHINDAFIKTVSMKKKTTP